MGPKAGLCLLEKARIVPDIFFSLLVSPPQVQQRLFTLFYVCTPNRALWCVGHVITLILTAILVLPTSYALHLYTFFQCLLQLIENVI